MECLIRADAGTGPAEQGEKIPQIMKNAAENGEHSQRALRSLMGKLISRNQRESNLLMSSKCREYPVFPFYREGFHQR